ncbi:HTH-type transcriptional regulator GlnR [Apilactobacillus kunkeei]|jgi:DNA-binding transcriptional MerR regulator|uniref:Glutamine synthetase repressor n=3 Tax=Apilactobacillus TaxID=2767877 RepID=A0A0M9DDL5_9LACO|nr:MULTISPECIES: MerR family transcriptional regulator [Lactobacillaceae]KOY69903.1 Glutamine synthetase repressor [Apilactobacillus kunkeei]KOY71265.1 Glutamine synthetase repressor [Apilactobacillus kunkeei]KOY73018.1 Glutamine synthetase repressor [Apilactobacillus kunkeei DSM 12361 = ATCC 700308]KOY74434.1 Glutamine synthetase repressor [Apilactobacillus kunkeei]KOY76233.1 Glutamine synthetase repressor [Apilactobacillus kunkeei]
MKEKDLRRSLSVLPIGTVMKLTSLTARQIRYYEEQGLVSPERNDGNRRMYSLNDIDVILEIKDYLDEGLNIAKIQEIYKKRKEDNKNNDTKELTDQEARKILSDELLNIGGLNSHDAANNSF